MQNHFADRRTTLAFIGMAKCEKKYISQYRLVAAQKPKQDYLG